MWCIASWIVLRLNLLGGGFFVIKSRVCRFRFVLVSIAFFFRLWFVEASSFSASSATPPSPLFAPEMLSCKKKKAKQKFSRLTNLHTSSTTKLDLVPFFWRTLRCKGVNGILLAKTAHWSVSQSSPIKTIFVPLRFLSTYLTFLYWSRISLPVLCIVSFIAEIENVMQRFNLALCDNPNDAIVIILTRQKSLKRSGRT